MAITLDQARERIGAGVIYRSYPDGPAEDGEIIRVTDQGVFVRYRGDFYAKLTPASNLEFLSAKDRSNP